MESRIYNVNLQSGYNSLTYIGISQYDAGVPLQFNVYDGATAASFPAGTTAKIQGVRPSGVGFNIDCTLTDNVVTVDSSTDMTGEAGKFPVEIRFTASGVDVGTVNFVFAIEKAPHPDGTIDADITRQQTFIERLEAVEDDKVPFPSTNKYGIAGQVLKTLGDGTTEWTNGASGQGVSEDLKVALLQIAQKVAYIDEDGQDYYDALYDALYPPAPPATLVSISAVYTQSGTVYDTDTLDSLKADLVVTAHYDDSTSAVVTTYTLSGTLTAGTSTITVSYSGKTTTFTVTVTANPLPYVSDGLIHMWDGIENTHNGHDSATSTWYDLAGSNDLERSSADITWSDDSANISRDKMNLVFTSDTASESCAGKSFEAVFTTDASTNGLVHVFNDSDAPGKVCIYTDNTFAVRGASGKTYPSGESVITDLHYVCGVFDANGAVSAVYANGVAVTQGNTTHSLSGQKTNVIIGQTDSGYRFGGKIYAIRVYDKQLSAAEVASNYAVDVNRFGL